VSEVPLEGLSQQELEQRLAHALAIGDEEAAGSVEILLARCLLDASDATAARRHAERAVALQRRVRSDERDLARALEVFGRATRAAGDDDAATGAYLEAIDIAGRLGHRDVVAALLNELGAMAATAGDRGRARDLLSAALRTAPEPREDAARRAELGLARIELDDGDDASAARRALRVLHGGADGEAALVGALLLHDAAMVATRRGDHETARRRCELALPVVREQGAAADLIALLASLGGACRGLVDLPAARAYYEEAVERCEQLDGPREAVVTRSGLLLDLGALCLVDMAQPALAVGHLNAALVGCDEAGLLDRSVTVTRLLHQASTALGDAGGVRRWHAAMERAAFVAAVAHEAAARAERGSVVDMPAMVLGDPGGRPAALRIPGGRVADGILWRRRLAAELKRAAPRGRVAVVRGRVQARTADAPLGESLQLLVVERDRVEARFAELERGPDGVVCGPWLAAGDDQWPGGRDRLVEALREALG
jgi:tetratricopeptide (TPR) repeat protein